MTHDAPNPKHGDERLELAEGDARAIRRKDVDAIDRSGAAINTSAACQADLAGVMTQAIEAAWDEALRCLGGAPVDPLPLWTEFATRILTAVGDGERDPKRLKLIALDALEGYSK